MSTNGIVVWASVAAFVCGGWWFGALSSRVTAAEDAVSAKEKNMTVNLGQGVTMELVLIRPGEFVMGSEERSYEKPKHKVKIARQFYMGKFEVTQAQWDAVMGKGSHYFPHPKHPVTRVSWHDCRSFVAKVNEMAPGWKFSLPTEAQWEYACRAGSAGKYSFGDDEKDLDDYAWYGNASTSSLPTGAYGPNTDRKAHPVGEKKPNAWGLYDMHGNAWEWCEDVWHDNYEGAPTDGSAWTTADDKFRVLRGGSWTQSGPDLRSSHRILLASGYKNQYDPAIIGFRVVAVEDDTTGP